MSSCIRIGAANIVLTSTVNYWKNTGSMSAKGNCYDNACAESFFHSFKNNTSDSLGMIEK
jgi:hypothetical protein